MVASEDVSTDINPIAWWKSHVLELPKWAHAFQMVLLVQPSSATAERVFSIVQHFSAQQQSSLEDYLELSVMLQYSFNCTLMMYFCNVKITFWKAKWMKERAKWVNWKAK